MAKNNIHNLDFLLTTCDAVKKIARNAGEILLDCQTAKLSYKYKLSSIEDPYDIITNADRASEKLIISKLRQINDEYSVLSEESGQIGRSEYRWIIDPLDGTKEYSRGFFLFSVNISLEYQGKSLLAVIYLPKLNDIYSAIKNNGAYLNSDKLTVSSHKSLSESFIIAHPPRYLTDKIKFSLYWQKLINLSQKSYRFRAWAFDALSLCWIAQGVYDGYYLPAKYPQWFDIAAGLLVLKEGGGKITTINNSHVTENNYHEGMIASNGLIHQEILSIVKKT